MESRSITQINAQQQFAQLRRVLSFSIRLSLRNSLAVDRGTLRLTDVGSSKSSVPSLVLILINKGVMVHSEQAR